MAILTLNTHSFQSEAGPRQAYTPAKPIPEAYIGKVDLGA
ncbi:hypothetical protein MNBD_PLANCTO03-2255 [hydrothermal vent metagenome]|uniref:Uncharacterized protein n=1 Tax=hydrothermal vent metagenome TaxID=652676 RepID=A0A3B1DPE6_9ZZZZ